MTIYNNNNYTRLSLCKYPSPSYSNKLTKDITLPLYIQNICTGCNRTFEGSDSVHTRTHWSIFVRVQYTVCVCLCVRFFSKNGFFSAREFREGGAQPLSLFRYSTQIVCYMSAREEGIRVNLCRAWLVGSQGIDRGRDFYRVCLSVWAVDDASESAPTAPLPDTLRIVSSSFTITQRSHKTLHSVSAWSNLDLAQHALRLPEQLELNYRRSYTNTRSKFKFVCV